MAFRDGVVCPCSGADPGWPTLPQYRYPRLCKDGTEIPRESWSRVLRVECGACGRVWTPETGWTLKGE